MAAAFARVISASLDLILAQTSLLLGRFIALTLPPNAAHTRPESCHRGSCLQRAGGVHVAAEEACTRCKASRQRTPAAAGAGFRQSGPLRTRAGRLRSAELTVRP